MRRKINDGLTKKERFKLRHPNYSSEYLRTWNQNHPNRDNGNYTRTSEKTIARNHAEKYPLAEFCEVCPEDDKRKATQRHHPDYAYPDIFVSCCASCHNYIDKGHHKGVD
jgi:hypothetical protein